MSKLALAVLLLATGCLAQPAAAATIADILIPIRIDIPTTNLNEYWVLCGVPASSCKAGAPLTITSASEPFQRNTLPPIWTVDKIQNVNLDILESGYITYLGLDTSALDHVVIALRNGFVKAGDPWPFATPETQLAADILAGNAAGVTRIRTFFDSNLSAFPQIDGNGNGSGGLVYRFSDASIVGSVGPIAAAPEASSGALMVVGLVTVLCMSRRLGPCVHRRFPS